MNEQLNAVNEVRVQLAVLEALVIVDNSDLVLTILLCACDQLVKRIQDELLQLGQVLGFVVVLPLNQNNRVARLVVFESQSLHGVYLMYHFLESDPVRTDRGSPFHPVLPHDESVINIKVARS